MMSDSGRAVEARARRAAKKVGLVARKSRKRAGSADNFGESMLVHPDSDRAAAGFRYDMTAQQVIGYCTK
jgi:hypothetical protein